LELTRLGERTFVVESPVKIGVIELEGGSLLVDTGKNEDLVRKLTRSLEERGKGVTHVIVTHSHADHTGALAFAKRRCSCSVGASPMEAAVVENPLLEPTCLWGGSPPKALLSPFVLSKPCQVDLRLQEGKSPFDEGIEILELSGHSFQMIGVLSPDGVLFTADAFFPEELIRKHGILYQASPRKSLLALEKVRGSKARLFVPSHGQGRLEDPEPWMEATKDHIESVFCALLEATSSWTTLEGVERELLDRFEVSETLEALCLARSSLRGYVSDLLEEGKLQMEVRGKEVLLRRA